jgi:hypothetical protein
VFDLRGNIGFQRWDAPFTSVELASGMEAAFPISNPLSSFNLLSNDILQKIDGFAIPALAKIHGVLNDLSF